MAHVANESCDMSQVMKEQGIELGLSADNIRVCGLPLRQMFWHVDTSHERKLQLRHELGLDALRPVVLLMGIKYMHTHTHTCTYTHTHTHAHTHTCRKYAGM